MRVLTITARPGDKLPDREPLDTERGYEARVLRWAVPDLTEEEAERAIASIPVGGEKVHGPAPLVALLRASFPDAEIRGAP